jgi:hypothetical protein
VLIHAGGFNLALLMRALIGVGTPRGLQGRVATLIATLLELVGSMWTPDQRVGPRLTPDSSTTDAPIVPHHFPLFGLREVTSATGC